MLRTATASAVAVTPASSAPHENANCTAEYIHELGPRRVDDGFAAPPKVQPRSPPQVGFRASLVGYLSATSK
jgi:hypothetical protein